MHAHLPKSYVDVVSNFITFTFTYTHTSVTAPATSHIHGHSGIPHAPDPLLLVCMTGMQTRTISTAPAASHPPQRLPAHRHHFHTTDVNENVNGSTISTGTTAASTPTHRLVVTWPRWLVWLPVRCLWGRWHVWWHSWVVTAACTGTCL